MPCSDGGPSYEQVEQEERDLKTMTRLACDRCKEIEARGGNVPAWAMEWWTRHKAKDRERLKEDAVARRESKIRKTALAKLTKKEREELGL